MKNNYVPVPPEPLEHRQGFYKEPDMSLAIIKQVFIPFLFIGSMFFVALVVFYIVSVSNKC